MTRQQSWTQDQLVAQIRARVDRGEGLASDTVLSHPAPNAPATEAEIAEAESILGHPLPDVLRRLYLEIDNGGFGPGYGLLGVRGGWRDEEGTAIDHPTEGWPHVPRGLVPLCHWGCAIYSFVDCRDGSAKMWGWDPNPVPHERLEFALFPELFDLTDWLARWLAGQERQPWAVQDRTTGKWRGATDAEWKEVIAEWSEDRA